MPTNIEIMKKAITGVKTIEVTRAVRATKIGQLKIKKKQPIGFLDGDLIAVGEDTSDVLNKVVAKLDLGKVEVITIYYGADANSAETEQVGGSIRERYPQLQIEVVRGGQPHYSYIVSVE
jgi:dihydroxyacetone kinase-like predicted kinase